MVSFASAFSARGTVVGFFGPVLQDCVLWGGIPLLTVAEFWGALGFARRGS
jgi:hypothetical protein